MSGGYAGKILRLDLTNKKYDAIPTDKYKEWVGGEGMGTALFWDEVDKDYITDTAGKSGFEPENVLVILSGPLQGTIAPNGGRCEVMGMAPEAYPMPQFTRSNFGGRFSAMLKFAGYDAIVVKGASDRPVWVDIQNDQVLFQDAGKMWGLDTYETQEEIWQEVGSVGEWKQVGSGRNAGRTTQRSAVLTIGQAGENLARVASLQHDAGRGAGQGGFGAVFGSKKLKAISVLGTGSVPIARPKDLLETRVWYRKYSNVGSPGGTYSFRGWGAENFGRATNCYGCDRGCNQNPNVSNLAGAENMCVEAYYNNIYDFERMHFAADIFGYQENVKVPEAATEDNVLPSTYLQRYGINAYAMSTGGQAWLRSLYQRGLLGKGKKINTDLDFSQLGKKEFAIELLRRIAYREEIGDDLAEGPTRAAKKWGVFDEDVRSGILPQVYWLGEIHWGVQVDWAYESLFGVRDINMHTMSTILTGKSVPIEKRVERMAEIGAPFHDPMMSDRSEEGVYSIGMARCVAWHRRYSTFYKNSIMLCDWNSPLWFNGDTPDGKGLSPEYETRFLNAVTGMDITYEEGLEIGRKIWNLQRAIVTMHGRHRDQEYFPPFEPYDSYIYHEGEPYIQNNKSGSHPSKTYTAFKNGKWSDEVCLFPLRKDKMDEFKTKYYDLEGWDTETGRPTRAGLESLGLKHVADELEARGRLPR